jgi:hypothetical protein
MCTVSIVPKGKNGFILTSNRDEAPDRVSLPPEFYKIESTDLLFPKDIIAGGTWIGISDKNRVICLLNGAYEKHIREHKYRLSRGVVVRELLLAGNISDAILAYDLQNVEPFTLVIADWNSELKFYEFVWDGQDKKYIELPLESKIWSSATLYTNDMKRERKYWFESFKKKKTMDSNSLLKFHETAGSGNLDYGVVMDRGFVKTTSITQIVKIKTQVEMRFKNLKDQSEYHKTFNLSQLIDD